MHSKTYQTTRQFEFSIIQIVTIVKKLRILSLKLRSSKSSIQSTTAGHVGQNSSVHVARSVAVIWRLFLFR